MWVKGTGWYLGAGLRAGSREREREVVAGLVMVLARKSHTHRERAPGGAVVRRPGAVLSKPGVVRRWAG